MTTLNNNVNPIQYIFSTRLPDLTVAQFNKYLDTANFNLQIFKSCTARHVSSSLHSAALDHAHQQLNFELSAMAYLCVDTQHWTELL